jgi:sugar phosphate isomerase/epimerase
MQFGIIASQIKFLVPEDLTPEETISHIAGFDISVVVRDLFSKGFNPIELTTDLSIFLPRIFSPESIEKLLKTKEDIGVDYTIHLPLWSVEPSTPLESVRLGSVQAIIDAIKTTAPLEPEVFVLHATGSLAAEFYRMSMPTLAKNYVMGQFQDGARKSLEVILSKTDVPSNKLAIETIEFPFDSTLTLAKEFDLSICLDTGHVLVGFSGPVDLFDVLDAASPNLAEVHLHDGPWQGPEARIGYGKDHLPLGEGDLDIAQFFDKLIEINFDGPVIFELSVGDALASLEFIRSIRPDVISSPPFPS